MKRYIDKDALVTEIEKWVSGWTERLYNTNPSNPSFFKGGIEVGKHILTFIDTLEMKTDEDNSLEKFKSLQHITRDLHQTLEDWGYAPNLYFFDGMWAVSWISCEDGDSIKDFEGNTPEEAIDKAYNWFHSTFCNS